MKTLITPNFINKTIDDYYDLPDNIPIDYGVNLEFSYDMNNFISICTENPREIKLFITSFRGISFDAAHYYGSLNISSLSEMNVKTKKISCTSGYPDKFKPKEMLPIKIELYQTLTKAELKTKRFATYKAGDCTTCFNSIIDVVKEAVRIYKKHFAREWVLVSSTMSIHPDIIEWVKQNTDKENQS